MAVMRNAIYTVVCACLFGACLLAQGADTSPALQKAIVVEEGEHDLRGAAALYAEIASDQGLDESVRGQAWLRLGRARQRLGDDASAREALENAVRLGGDVAERARALLQDPDQGGDRARQLRERAQALVQSLISRGRQIRDSPLETKQGRDLLWIGAPAAPEIVRGLRELQAANRSNVYRRLTPLLWIIGGPDAEKFLAEVRAESDAEFRHAMLNGIHEAESMAMVAQAQAFLSDPDPSGAVVIAAIKGGQGGSARVLITRYDLDAVFPVLESSVPTVRVAAYERLASYWPMLRHEPDELATASRLAPHLKRDVAAVDPQVSRAATRLLGRIGVLVRPLRQLFLEILPGLAPDATLAVGQSEAAGFEGPADDADRVLAMLPKLGPLDGDRQTKRARAAQLMVAVHASHWRREALPVVLEAARLGYFTRGGFSGWIARQALPEDALAVTRALGGTAAFADVVKWLADLERVPAECFADLRRFLTEQSPDGNHVYRANVALGKTGHEDAPAFLLGQLASRSASRYFVTCPGLLFFSDVAPGDAARDALRQALTFSTDKNDDSGVRTSRNQIFARLVRMGDVDAIDALGKANELGMQASPAFDLPSNDGVPGLSHRSGAGVSWLVEHMPALDGGVAPWHGYDEATSARILERLLEPVAPGHYPYLWIIIDQALQANWNPHGVRRSRNIPGGFYSPPPAVVDVLCRAWMKRAAVDDAVTDRDLKSLLTLLEIGRRRVVKDANVSKKIARLHAACHGAKSSSVRLLALDLLPDSMSESQSRALVGSLSDGSPSVAARARELVRAAGIPISADVLIGALQSPSATTRQQVLAELAPVVQGDATALVVPLLRDTDALVRAAACRFLGTQMRPTSVSDLLVALKDPEHDVRKEAADALTAIRFYHDEKAHWDRVFAGASGVTKNGAAEALLKQAAADQSLETRILAIRSLGLLGVAETLPFLIGWSEDVAVGSEAREAIARIHAMGK